MDISKKEIEKFGAVQILGGKAMQTPAPKGAMDEDGVGEADVIRGDKHAPFDFVGLVLAVDNHLRAHPNKGGQRPRNLYEVV